MSLVCRRKKNLFVYFDFVQWNISDNFFQNRQRIKQDLESKTWKAGSKGSEELSPFDELWLCLFRHLGELCVDSRPAVRKSAGQTLFSTISAHGGLLHQNTWHTVLWQVSTHFYI